MVIRIATLTFAAAACVTPAPTGPRQVQVGLRYEIPMNVGPGEVGPTIPGGVALAPFTDGRRGNPAAIGVNEEDGQQYPVVAANPVLEDVTSALQMEFERLFGPAPYTAQAAKLVQGQVLKFWVSGGRTYHGEVRLRITVVDRLSNAVTFDRVVDASERTWGATLSAENDAKVMYIALRRALMVVLQDPAFFAALGARMAAPTLAPPPPPGSNL